MENKHKIDLTQQEFFREDYLDKSDLRETGFGGTEEEWRYCREIIVQAIDHDGTFLDLGAANGRLSYDVQKWGKEKGIDLDVYGVDFVPELIEKAKVRMPEIADHFIVGDINTFIPNQDFDYIRGEIIHMHPEKVAETLQRYLDKIKLSGKLIVAQYDDTQEDEFESFIDFMQKLPLGDSQVIKNEATCLVVFSK